MESINGRKFVLRDRSSAAPSRWASQDTLFDDAPQIDRAVVIGISASCGLVLLGALLGGNPLQFISPVGMVLVIGGTIASTLVQFSFEDIGRALQSARSAMFLRTDSVSERITYLIRLARLVKDEGVLSLEREAVMATDPFLRLGLELTVDGQKPEDIRSILKNEMRTTNERGWRSVMVWEAMGNFAPAMGLIGTLLGLIQMLGALQDSSAVGPAMSLALVATLYGAVTANLFFFPLAGKLRLGMSERSQLKDVTLEALLSLAALESPVVMEQRLQSFSQTSVNG